MTDPAQRNESVKIKVVEGSKLTSLDCDQIKFCKEKQPKICNKFLIKKYCGMGGTFAYCHPDNFEEGNKKITNHIKEMPEYLEKPTKEGFNQLIYQKRYQPLKVNWSILKKNQLLK